MGTVQKPAISSRIWLRKASVFLLALYCFVKVYTYISHSLNPMEPKKAFSILMRNCEARFIYDCTIWFPSIIFKQLLKYKASFPFIAKPTTETNSQARCECLHLIKINCQALWLDEITRSELELCDEWKRALNDALINLIYFHSAFQGVFISCIHYNSLAFITIH